MAKITKIVCDRCEAEVQETWKGYTISTVFPNDTSFSMDVCKSCCEKFEGMVNAFKAAKDINIKGIRSPRRQVDV